MDPEIDPEKIYRRVLICTPILSAAHRTGGLSTLLGAIALLSCAAVFILLLAAAACLIHLSLPWDLKVIGFCLIAFCGAVLLLMLFLIDILSSIESKIYLQAVYLRRLEENFYTAWMRKP
jgi:hypothetical protein